MKSGVLRKLLTATTAALLALVALEVGLRVAHGRYLNPFLPDPTLGFRLKPGFDGRYRWTPVSTDVGGYRISKASIVSTGRSILFVGDSVTFGHDVSAEDSYPQQMRQSLGSSWRIVNAAVPGYNLAQTLLRLREFLAHEKPALVVYGLCLNDIVAANLPAKYEDIDPHLERRLRGRALGWSVLAAFVDRRVGRLAFAARTRSDGERIEPFLSDVGAAPGISLEAFDRQWAELERLQLDRGIPIVVVVFPYREQIVGHPEWRAPQELVRKKCEASPLRCLDALPVLLEHRGEPLYLSSAHFTPAGHRVVADWLAAGLRPLLAG